tara:strand:- start:2610 stop:2738 length:129 start_codon:yes stop_codon:yes gene_type:complete
MKMKQKKQGGKKEMEEVEQELGSLIELTLSMEDEVNKLMLGM